MVLHEFHSTVFSFEKTLKAFSVSTESLFPLLEESQIQQNAPSFAESPDSLYGAVDTSSSSA